ncbi:MAG: hypothetical protein ACRD5H_18400 [Nitrososphaerales archaeon]
MQTPKVGDTILYNVSYRFPAKIVALATVIGTGPIVIALNQAGRLVSVPTNRLHYHKDKGWIERSDERA